MRKEQLEKLPKWAQYEFRMMESTVNSQQRIINGLMRKKETNILVEHLQFDLRYFLDNRSRIRIQLKDDNKLIYPGRYIDINLSESMEELEIFTSDWLIIRPEATNHIHIKSSVKP